MARVKLTDRPVEIKASVLYVDIISNPNYEYDIVSCDIMIAGVRKKLEFMTKFKKGKAFVENRLLKTKLVWD